MSDYDARQYRHMVDLISRFENESIDIRQLIDDLDALVSTLQEPGRKWMDEFRNVWWVLEEVYSVALDRGDAFFDDEAVKLINSSIANLGKLIADKLNAAQQTE